MKVKVYLIQGSKNKGQHAIFLKYRICFLHCIRCLISLWHRAFLLLSVITFFKEIWVLKTSLKGLENKPQGINLHCHCLTIPPACWPIKPQSSANKANICSKTEADSKGDNLLPGIWNTDVWGRGFPQGKEGGLQLLTSSWRSTSQPALSKIWTTPRWPL